MTTRTINLIIVVIAIVAGIVGASIQANEHNHSVMVAKASVYASNSMAWEEYKAQRATHLQHMVDSYVYMGEEDAPELVEANYWLNKINAVEKKFRSTSQDEYADVYSSYMAEKDAAAWNVGRCLVAWSERTGRYAVSYGEGYVYFYFHNNEDGSRRNVVIHFSNETEVDNYLVSVRKAFPGI